MSLADPFFWTALATIIGVNVVLSGDNAVVIALAARSLPPRRQRLAIRWGAAAAIVIFGARSLVRVMERFPAVVPIGAALIGFVAGKMAWEDHAIAAWTGAYPEGVKYTMACVGAGIVVIVGQWLAQRAGRRALSAEAEHPAR